ncbi:HupE/UreJ family protein [Massilia sp. CCM 9210]|uniref:HupE/UreJ family protein n=1 Tax=Massilia scottii TaxID=3057166 RepID=UPI00279650AF|nr:HupE/UreJ family protein [Massilia sp. CCM 9210]MDQ1813052.1 HupE/UreJ family protein [Massilia sp. CCM 9210]
MLINGSGDAARAWLLGMLLCLVTAGAFAHGVSESDQSFLQGATGVHFLPYLYLGAKHMVTGYDHLLFLCGVIFFLYRMKDIGVYVTLFALGHSTTLLLGVLNGWHINAYLVDAIIGLSIVYRAFDNLGGFKTVSGFQPNKKAAVLIFGFFHGLGLATKLQDFSLSPDGLVPNMIAFNLGVELGQLLALGMILILVRYWRTTASFARHALTGNFALMSAGFVLAGLQFTGYISQ